MEKEFIPYEQAVVLKELGFDEACIAHFTKDYLMSQPYFIIWEERSKSQDVNKMSGYGVCLAPLYQQVFRWFREEYNFDSYIRPNIVIDIPKTYQFNINDNTYDTWYETYLEAELECLKKLIEIVKNK